MSLLGRQSSSPSLAPMLGAVLLVVAVLALFAGSTGGSFVWDDAYQIAENPAVTAGAPLRAYFLDRTTTTSRADYNTRVYRPLRNVAYRAIALTFGVTPRAFRFA